MEMNEIGCRQCSLSHYDPTLQLKREKKTHSKENLRTNKMSDKSIDKIINFHFFYLIINIIKDYYKIISLK